MIRSITVYWFISRKIRGKRTACFRMKRSREAGPGWWQHLKDLGLISEKKYKNLTRKVVREEGSVRFINRQMTETSQIIKHVTTLFKAHYPDLKVHAINDNLSSSIRDSFKLYKIRDLNNTHHAYDAFLAGTIGCFMDSFFDQMNDIFATDLDW